MFILSIPYPNNREAIFDNNEYASLYWGMKQIRHEALTFDDVLLAPRLSDFGRHEVSLRTKLTRAIDLDLPLISSPMDTVTESCLAIALANAGGIGIIHRNLSIKDQAKEVRAVKKHKLLVGAAVGSSPGFEARVKALVTAGVDCILIDSAHGHSKQVINATRYVKDNYKVEVISGNVATAEGAHTLIEAGADALRIGMGPGAICSTRIISGMGVPQLTALLETCDVAQKAGIPAIADGGIMHSGDITKALAAGASSVMLGRIFAAATESPGKLFELDTQHVPSRFQSIINGSTSYRFKQYRGMGSASAMQKGLEISSEDEYHGKNYTHDVLVAEGVEGMVPEKGSVAEIVAQLVGGVQSGMYYTGAKTVTELQNDVEFSRITQASLAESHPHDLFITDPGASYS